MVQALQGTISMQEMQAPGSALAATGCRAAQYGSWCASPVGSAQTAYTQPYGGMHHLGPDPQAAACWGTSGACQHRPSGYAAGSMAHGTPTHVHAAGVDGRASVPQAVGYGMPHVPEAAGQDGRAGQGEGEGEGNGPSEALLSMLQQCHRRVSGSLADVAGMQ